MKTLKCRGCGHEFEAPDEANRVQCPECGLEFTVPVFGLLRGRLV